MKRRLGFLLLAAAAAALLLLSVPARADTAWRATLVIGEPTEIPGAVLQPGRYLVKVLDTQETRKVVQFLNTDESAVVATAMAIPTYRVTPAEQNEFVYFQRAEGQPQALKSWIYPGNNYGVEFVYPKAEAVALAQARHQDVYSAPSAKPEAKETVVAISPELKEKPVEEKAPPPAPVKQAMAAPAPTAVPAPPPAEPPPAPKKAKHLPKTGSELPLLAIAGLSALGAAAALRAFRSPNA